MHFTHERIILCIFIFNLINLYNSSQSGLITNAVESLTDNKKKQLKKIMMFTKFDHTIKTCNSVNNKYSMIKYNEILS